MKYMITILGAGAIGSAIGGLIKKGHAVNYWDIVEDKIRYSAELKNQFFKEAIVLSDVIFICVPSMYVRELLEEIKNVKKGLIVICVAKGMEEKTMKTMDLVMEEVLDSNIKSGLLYGPMLASEIKEGQPGFAHFAIKDKQAFSIVNSLFDKNLCLTYSGEPYSIAIAGILKNIYALGLGIADGLNYKNNFKGWLVSQSVKEMKLIIAKLGQLDDEIEYSFLSDFITTGYSEDSRNHLAGVTIGKNEKRIESEGTRAIASVQKLLGEKIRELFLFNALAEIVEQNADAGETYKQLISNCYSK